MPHLYYFKALKENWQHYVLKHICVPAPQLTNVSPDISKALQLVRIYYLKGFITD